MSTATGARRFPTLGLEQVPPWASIGIAVAAWTLLAPALLPAATPDFVKHVKPWLDHLQTNGGFAALTREMDGYAPPYLYLLAAVSYFDFPPGDQVLIKLLNAPFVVGAALSVGVICARLGLGRRGAVAAAAGAALLPTLALDSFAWGRPDAIEASLLLGCVALGLEGRPVWAAAAFFAAVAVTPQALILLPFALAMTLAGRAPLRSGLVAPVICVGAILPAAFIGRPVSELALGYVAPHAHDPQLTLGAPNPYIAADVLGLDHDAQGPLYAAALGAAVLAGAAIALMGAGRGRMKGRAVLVLAALSAVAMPWILPGMDARSFLPADLLLFTLACADRRFVAPAVALQAGSLLAYMPELASAWGLDPDPWRRGLGAGSVVVTGVVVYMAACFRQEMGAFWSWPAIRRAMRLSPGPL